MVSQILTKKSNSTLSYKLFPLLSINGSAGSQILFPFLSVNGSLSSNITFSSSNSSKNSLGTGSVIIFSVAFSLLISTILLYTFSHFQSAGVSARDIEEKITNIIIEINYE